MTRARITTTVLVTAFMAVTGWFVLAQEPDLLPPDLRAWVDAHGRPFTVASSDSFHPYSFLDQDGRLSGIGGDYLALIARRTGVQFEARRFASFDDMLTAARAREVDIIPFVIAADERRDYLSFTESFYRIQDRIVMRDDTDGVIDLDALVGKRVGVVKGYTLVQTLRDREPPIDPVTFPNELTMIRALSIGDIDALIADLGAASYYTEQEGITNLRVVGDVGTEDWQTFASRSDWPELHRILDIGLDSITNTERATIHRRWISLEGLDPNQFGRILNWLFVLLAAGAILTIGAFVWARSLRRQVAMRTAALRTELTQRRRVEAENQRLAQAVEQSAEIVLIVSRDGRLEYANRAFEQMRNAADIVGQPFASIAAGEDRAVLNRALDELELGDVWRGNVYLVSIGNEDIHIAMTIAPIQHDLPQRLSGRADGFVATGHDIGHEEELERRLRHGEKISALGRMAGGIAHDFNNLLTPIIGNADLLRDTVGERGQAPLEAIASAAERAQQMVERILSFSQLRERERMVLDMTREVGEGITFLRSLLPSTVEIRSRLEHGHSIRGDRTQIQQILMNLGTNAADAMKDRAGVIEITLDDIVVATKDADALDGIAPGRYCRVTVRDDGIGMGKQEQSRIFDPYFTTKRPGKGTGLGLSTVHGIVRSHDGAIRITSAPSQGTIVEILLPAVAARSEQQPATAPAKSSGGSGRSVLVVDDDEMVLTTVCRMLERMGYVVTPQTDPRAALQDLADASGAFDVLLTDQTMPHMTGVQLAHAVREQWPTVPIVVMSGNANQIDEAGLTTIGKPFRPQELAQSLEQVLADAAEAAH